MRVQQLKIERDRIKAEEVAPLENQLRQLEQQQEELATRLAGLQNEETSEDGRSLEFRDSMLEEFPLPPLSLEGLSSSRTSTVRDRNRGGQRRRY